MIYATIYRCLRASTLVVLNSNIAIFITTKYQNVPYNGGAKAIFFGSVFFYLCIHTAFDYFTHFYFYSFVFTLILFVRSHFFYSFFSFIFIFFFFYIAVWTLYIVCALTLLLFFYSYIFFFSYILFFFLFCSHCYCSRYIILLWCLYYFIVLEVKIDPLMLDVCKVSK